MGFLVGGLALAVHGILFFMSGYALEHGVLPTWDEADKTENDNLYRQARLISFLGLFIALIGVVEFADGRIRSVDAQENLLCATVLFYLNCQARLVLYGVRHKPGRNKGGNLRTLLTNAFSIGVFPAGGGFLSALIAVSQSATALFLFHGLAVAR